MNEAWNGQRALVSFCFVLVLSHSLGVSIKPLPFRLDQEMLGAEQKQQLKQQQQQHKQWNSRAFIFEQCIGSIPGCAGARAPKRVFVSFFGGFKTGSGGQGRFSFSEIGGTNGKERVRDFSGQAWWVLIEIHVVFARVSARINVTSRR